MSDRYFVDTSILMYAHDTAAGAKHERARALVEEQVVVNTRESILETLDLEQRYHISFWDALVVQAAQAAGASILYSEDLSDGHAHGSVRVVNPLAVE